MGAAIYKEQGTRLYKIKNNMIIELDLQSYNYGIIGCNVGSITTSPILPNEHAKPIPASEFNTYYKEFLEKIKRANKKTGSK